ncbi:ShlB/FhaC/HecB family hemolysin secretion/activation protein [Candidatus Omnitrophota bacterium]
MRKELEKKLKAPPMEKPEIKKGEEAEKAKEEETFINKKIDLIGCESFSADDFKEIVEKYENREVSLKELDVLAKEIEKEYFKRGVMAACFLPPQEIKEGVVILQVVEAKMGDLEIQKHGYFKEDMINDYWKIKPGEVLRYDKMLDSLYLMNKNPDREVKATLHAGKTPQTTDVVLNVDTRLPIHFTSSFDKEGGVLTGRKRKGLGIKHNNFLGFDDTLLVGHMFGDDFSGTYAYHRVPINSFGTSLLYGYNYSKAFPKKEYEPFGIDTRVKNTSFFIYQDMFKNGDYLGEVYLGLDAQDKTTKTKAEGTLNRDRLRILRLGSNFVHRGSRTVTTLNPEFSQGINGFGARRRDRLSSRGAKNTFSKFNLGAQCKRALPLNLEANLKLNSQFSSTELAPQEEFFLGGINSVRGYPSGDYLADSAVQANLELLFPAFFIPKDLRLPYSGPLKEEVTGLIFFDYGYGEKRGAGEPEKKTANLKSVGAGIRIRLLDWVLLRLEWGFPLGDQTITEKASSRFHISFDLEM